MPNGVQCPGCGYDLGGLAFGPCPECGREFDHADHDEFVFRMRRLAKSQRRRKWQIGALGTVCLAWVAAALSDGDVERGTMAIVCAIVAAMALIAIVNGFWIVAREHQGEYRSMWCDMMWMNVLPAAWAVALCWSIRIAAFELPGFVMWLATPVLALSGMFAAFTPSLRRCSFSAGRCVCHIRCRSDWLRCSRSF